MRVKESHVEDGFHGRLVEAGEGFPGICWLHLSRGHDSDKNRGENSTIRDIAACKECEKVTISHFVCAHNRYSVTPVVSALPSFNGVIPDVTTRSHQIHFQIPQMAALSAMVQNKDLCFLFSILFNFIFDLCYFPNVANCFHLFPVFVLC